jgi:hypothetical protein
LKKARMAFFNILLGHDMEIVRPGRLFDVRLLDPVHPGGTRTLLQPASEGVESVRRAAGHGFDGAIVTVSHPAVQSQVPGLVTSGATVPYALHTTEHMVMSADFHRLVFTVGKFGNAIRNRFAAVSQSLYSRMTV